MCKMGCSINRNITVENHFLQLFSSWSWTQNCDANDFTTLLQLKPVMIYPLHFILYPSIRHVFGQDQCTSTQGRTWQLGVKESPKPLAILTFNQADVRSVSLLVCRTTQLKQSQTLKPHRMKETWQPVKAYGESLYLVEVLIYDSLAFRTTGDPSLVDAGSPAWPNSNLCQ